MQQKIKHANLWKIVGRKKQLRVRDHVPLIMTAVLIGMFAKSYLITVLLFFINIFIF